MAALWHLTSEHSWLLRNVDVLFESCERPGRLYGCKFCGDAIPRADRVKHFEMHREELKAGRPRTGFAAGNEHRFETPSIAARDPLPLDDVAEGRREAVEKIVEFRNRGESYPWIAKTLNDNGIAPFGGGKAWYPVTVRSVFLRHTAEAVQA